MRFVPELMQGALRRLREEAGLSRSQLSRATVREGYAGVPESTIEALETKAGRVPDASTIEALSEALGVDPDVFYEYPIAQARRATATALRERAQQ